MQSNLLTETWLAPHVKVGEGFPTSRILYKTGHHLLAGQNAGIPTPRKYPVILGKASGQLTTQGRNSLLHGIKYTGTP